MIWIWLGFIAFVLLMLALDLGVFHRTAHVVSMKEAISWSAVWIAFGLSFTAFVYFGYENHWLGLGNVVDQSDGTINNGATAAIKYLTGYVVEKSLSVDNVFVIAMIFSFFAVPAALQHRVLFWGVLGALVMRGAMIALGAQLIASFHWVLYVFGVFLILTGVKMLFVNPNKANLGENALLRMTRKLVPTTDQYHGDRFFVQISKDGSEPAANGTARAVRMMTPLGLALIMVEFTDLIFAVDSIPAIFAITADPFLVFTSNVFAILGLRSLYFALAGLLDRFRYLKVSLAFVLVLVGVKMLTAEWLKEVLGKHFNFYVLGIIFTILLAGLVASQFAPRPNRSASQ